MVKGVYKFSVENRFNHVGRTCCCHVNVLCFKGFKDLFHYDSKLNVELVYLWLALKCL